MSEKQPIKRIYFVRHGETDANLLEYVPSREEPLNSTGLVQADKIAMRLVNIDVDRLISSEFVRAQETAKAITNLKPMAVEIQTCFGEMIEPSSLYGKPSASAEVMEFRKNRNENIENFDWRQEDGDSFIDVYNRLMKGKTLLETAPENNILVVTHGYFVRLFVATILLNTTEPNQKWHEVANVLKSSNTGLTHFYIENGIWKLLTWSDIAHFAE